MTAPYALPFYAKIALIFIGIFVFGYTMYISQDIIIPLVYATIIAILLNPFVNFLISKKMDKIIAISIAVVLMVIVTLGIIYIISSRISLFSETYPALKAKLQISSSEFIHWFSQKFNIRISKINTWINETQSEEIDNFAIGDRLTEIWDMLVALLLIPAYVFMILYYKALLLEFIRKLFKSEHHGAVVEVLTNTKSIIQTYLVGLFFEMIIVAVLNSAGLLLLGIDYAIILGITGAILNIIPFIGGIIGIALPMIVAYVTKDSSTYAILVFFVYIFIQFVDNNYIVPKIVASRVQLNALISVIVVLIGGAMWGISGMFLSIPLTAILKVIFDHIDSLKAWGFLMGNIVPSSSKFSFIKRKANVEIIKNI